MLDNASCGWKQLQGVAVSLALTLVLGAATTAQAQNASPPAQIGNIYNGTAHEPNPGAVHSGESAAGVALPPAAAKAETGTVENLNSQLLSGASQDNSAARNLACSTTAAACVK